MAAIFPGAVATQLQLLTAQNNSMVVLDADCDLDDDVITVDDASALPDSGYLTFVDTDEVIYYTSKTSNTLNGVTRGADNTTALGHIAGVDLEQRWNADYHNIITLEFVAVEQWLSNKFGLSTTQIVAPAGSHDSPVYTTSGDLDTGLYFSAANTLDVATGSTRAATWNSSQQLQIYKTTNQIILGTTNTVTISASAPASSRTYTIPDAGGSANFLLSGWAQIVNADISASAAIAQSKLSLSITNAEVNASAAIVYSKLSLTGGIVNADINASAAIAQSKLSLSITNSEVNASAAIARSKLAALTASRLMVTDGSGFDSVNSVTATEAGYLSGVTSAIQTQFGTKANLAGDSFTGDVTMTNQKAIIFREATGGGTDSVTVKAASAIATSWTLILPAAGPSANLQVLRVKDYTTGELEFGTGGGSGGINYLSTNPDAEAGTTGWAAYADAAGTTPVDGTGGSPSLTITRNTSSPLRGTGMFTLTKGATNRQGDGASYDFTIDAADKATVLQISFDYQVSSAFVAGDSSDVRIFIYDVTNAVLITPAPYTIQGGNGTPHKFVSTFQTASNSTSYRLIFHVATTNASAWTMDFDNVIVGPQKSVWGAPVGDWTSYTPSFFGFGTPSSVNFLYRRVGDSIECAFSFIGGTVTGTSASFTLPTGMNLDTGKLPPEQIANVGTWTRQDGTGNVGVYTTGIGGVMTVAPSSATNRVYFSSNNYIDGQPLLYRAIVANSGFNNSELIAGRFTVPILGWGSNVQMSNDADTRIVSARYYAANTQAVGNNVDTFIDFLTKDFDSHGAASNVGSGVTTTEANAWRYTAPVSGIYEVKAMLTLTVSPTTNTGEFSTRLYLNGSASHYLAYWTQRVATTSGNLLAITGSTLIKLNAGDRITLAAYQFSGGSLNVAGNANENYICISRLTGPSAIAATELVAAQYASSAANSVANYAGTPILIDFATKNFDTHGAVTTGASWKFTCPIGGKYRVTAAASTSSQTWAAGSICQLGAYKNGSLAFQIAYWLNIASFTGRNKVSGGSCVIQCVPGDYIDVRMIQNGGAGITLEADVTLNWISIERIGN